MKLAIGGDHAGYALKVVLLEYLQSQGHDVLDCGSYDPNPVDFPDIAGRLCDEVRNGSVLRGIMVCGTGVGASIAANKIPGIRAAVCHDIYSAHQCVEHDDVNVMCIGAQIVGSTLATELLEAFLKAEFSTAEEFRRRVAKLHEMDKKKY